jgi:AraC family transcriptional regulator
MEARIETLREKKMLGQRIRLSLVNNRTFELWHGFIPRRKEIKNAIRPDLYSIDIYGQQFFIKFDPACEFEKWAAVEVPDFSTIPGGLETFTLPGGLYAVFKYKGPGSAASRFIQQILTERLPKSEFRLDGRPHLALMGTKYLNEDPNSEEEIWIPIKSLKDHK